MPMAATKRDYYEVLGVARDASADDIKKVLSPDGPQVSPGPQSG